jgi:predicted nucleotidyltransferase
MGSTNETLSTTLFGKARREVLFVLYGSTDQALYMRQLARLTGLGMGALQRELEALSRAGIIERTAQGTHIFFKANAGCPIFLELKGIVAKTIGIGEILRKALEPLAEHIRWAFVHGSTAKGKETTSSDVDVMVVGDVKFEEVISALRTAQETTGREINHTVHTVEEFFAKVKKGHHFLSTVMREPKMFLVGEEDELHRLAGSA